MRLADFILRDMEAILKQWEAFATTLLPAAGGMTSLALRDHAPQILQAVAQDLKTPQTREEQAAKSMGRAPKPLDAHETAAQTHAVMRARSGFDINQLAAEYRALRASVLSLWFDACQAESPDPQDMIRFNEAIDQALAESISYFSAQVDQARDLLLGMLGHDMRTPLQTMQMTAAYLARINAGDEVSAAAARLISSGARMKELLDDLVDFNRSKLGAGLRVDPAEVNLAELFANELDLLRGAYPERRLELQVAGNVIGHWDGPRLQRVLRNLVVNGIKHGAPGGPVRARVVGNDAHVHFEVSNTGAAMEPERLTEQKRQKPDDGLGLGLHIVREIIKAHGGEVEVSSGQDETTFRVRLPRSLPLD